MKKFDFSSRIESNSDPRDSRTLIGLGRRHLPVLAVLPLAATGLMACGKPYSEQGTVFRSPSGNVALPTDAVQRSYRTREDCIADTKDPKVSRVIGELSPNEADWCDEVKDSSGRSTGVYRSPYVYGNYGSSVRSTGSSPVSTSNLVTPTKGQTLKSASPSAKVGEVTNIKGGFSPKSTAGGKISSAKGGVSTGGKSAGTGGKGAS